MQTIIPKKYRNSNVVITATLLCFEMALFPFCSFWIWQTHDPEDPSTYCLDQQIIVEIMKREGDGPFAEIVDVIDFNRDSNGIDVVHSNLYVGNKIPIESIRTDAYNQLRVHPQISSRLKLYKTCETHSRRQAMLETLFFEKPPRSDKHLPVAALIAMYFSVWICHFMVSVMIAVLFLIHVDVEKRNRCDRNAELDHKQF